MSTNGASPSDAADVVVIGAGHNGLVAACYLAEAGLDVVVVEATDTIGGMSASGPLIPGAPKHVINSGAAEFILLQAGGVAEELSLERYGLRTVAQDPSYVYLHPDGSSLAFWRDARRTAEEIRRFSSSDAAAYLEFARLVEAALELSEPYMRTHPLRVGARTMATIGRRAIARRRLLPRLPSLFWSSGDAVILERFEHPVVQSALYSLIGGVAPVSADGTGMGALLIGFLHRGGVLRPIGGMQALPDALAARLQAEGGSIVTGAAVESVESSGGRASAVHLEDGRVISARRGIVATCDPRQTLERLLPPDCLPPRLRARAAEIPAWGHGAGFVKLDVALGGHLRLDRHERWRGDGIDLRRPAIMIGTMDGVRRGYAEAAAGRVPKPEELLQWCFVPTGADPSQAPDGQDVLYVSAATMPLNPPSGWERTVGDATTAMTQHLSGFYDGGLDTEIGRRVETPEALANRLRVSNGCYFHVDYAPLRSGPLRPMLGIGGYKTPLAGLYLSGAGTHPGGGVSGLPGRQAALQLLRDES